MNNAVDLVYLANVAKNDLLEKLALIVKSKIGLPITGDEKYFFSIEVIERTHGSFLNIESCDLKSACGILSNSFERVTIGSFNSNVSSKEDSTVLWMTIYFSYSFKSGGSNGHQICSIWYDFTKGTLEVK